MCGKNCEMADALASFISDVRKHLFTCVKTCERKKGDRQTKNTHRQSSLSSKSLTVFYNNKYHTVDI